MPKSSTQVMQLDVIASMSSCEEGRELPGGSVPVRLDQNNQRGPLQPQ